MAEQRREEERRRQRSRESQLEAALEGVRDMAEWQATVAGEGEFNDGGAVPSVSTAAGGGGRGVGTSGSGPSEQSPSPAAETGGPRGAGYPPSETSGGRLRPSEYAGVDVGEEVRRQTTRKRK